MTEASTTTPGAAPIPKNDAPGVLSRLGDFLNPLLVREVRQAQRGRVFTVALVATVLITLMASVLLALDIDESWTRPGRRFFSVIYLFLAGSLMLIVPFQAFSSMGSEWDEHTYEMLVLSNLRPRQIVLGKLLAAAVQGLLLLALFMPFIAVAFLLQGVDLFVLGLFLGLTAFGSLWLSTVAIMLSALTRHRVVRVLLMVALGGGLIAVISGMVTLADESMRRPDQIAGREFWIVMPQVLGLLTLLAGLAFAIACNILTHEEENRSTNVRVLGSVGVLVALVMMAVNVTLRPSTSWREDVFMFTVGGIFVLTAFAIYFCSEPESLGRRVIRSVPRNRLWALLTLPWFPGAGRGTIYLLVHLVALAGGGLAIARWATPAPWAVASRGVEYSFMRDGGVNVVLAVLYAVLYSVVPIVLLGLVLKDTRVNRRIVRMVAMASPVLYVALPSLLGTIVSSFPLRERMHAGNVSMMLDGYFTPHDVGMPASLVALILLAVISCLACTPKIVRSVRETLRAHEVGSQSRGPST